MATLLLEFLVRLADLQNFYWGLAADTLRPLAIRKALAGSSCATWLLPFLVRLADFRIHWGFWGLFLSNNLTECKTRKSGMFCKLLHTSCSFFLEPEMEKRADSADISVLFFLIAVLIFWLCTRKETVLLALYY